MRSWMNFYAGDGDSFTTIFSVVFFLTFTVMSTSGIRCFQCGQYTDGPGSITPCLNYTEALHLKECPGEAEYQCIKYVNEGSVVRECAEECNEKRSDSWGTSIYCCSEDGCNSASALRFSFPALLGAAAALWARFGPAV